MSGSMDESSSTAASDNTAENADVSPTADGDKGGTVPAGTEGTGMPDLGDTVPFGNGVTLKGRQLMDGREMPVRLTMTVNSVVRGR